MTYTLQYVYVVDLDCTRTHTIVRCQQFVATVSAYDLYANLIICQPDFVCCLRTVTQSSGNILTYEMATEKVIRVWSVNLSS